MADSGTLLVTVLSATWWCVNLFSYRYVQRQSPRFRVLWWFNLGSLSSLVLAGGLELGGVIPSVTHGVMVALVAWVAVIGGVASYTLIQCIVEECHDDTDHHSLELTQVRVVV